MEVAAPDSPYLLVGDAIIASEGLSEIYTIKQSLAWIKFTIEAQCVNMMDESMSSFDYIKLLVEDNIDVMAKDLSSRNMVSG